jgi:hypothetical protein
VALEYVPHAARDIVFEIGKHDFGADALLAILPCVEEVLDNLPPLVATKLEFPFSHPEMTKPSGVAHGIACMGRRAGLQLGGKIRWFDDQRCTANFQI